MLLLSVALMAWGCGSDPTGNPDMCREFPSGGLAGSWVGRAGDVTVELDLEGPSPGAFLDNVSSGTAAVARGGDVDTLRAVAWFWCYQGHTVDIDLHRPGAPGEGRFEGRRTAVEGFRATRLEGALSAAFAGLAGTPVVLVRPDA